jgi:hypothetical protein
VVVHTWSCRPRDPVLIHLRNPAMISCACVDVRRASQKYRRILCQITCDSNVPAEGRSTSLLVRWSTFAAVTQPECGLWQAVTHRPQS